MVHMQYLISVIDSGEALAAGRTESATAKEMADIDVFNDQLQRDGYWVFAGGMGSTESATTIDNRGSETVITDGPYVESKEFIAGFWIVEAPDFDVVLKLGTDASKACNRKIEVRPFLEP
jgi:hypothetical protein